MGRAARRHPKTERGQLSKLRGRGRRGSECVVNPTQAPGLEYFLQVSGYSSVHMSVHRGTRTRDTGWSSETARADSHNSWPTTG
jgi:hypothetical protein